MQSLLRVNKAKASGKGIISVSDDGTETASVASAPGTSVKRPRGRPRKTADTNVAVEDDEIVIVEQDDKAVEPPAKKPRARKSVKPEADESEVKAAPRPRGRPSRARKSDPVSDQDEVVITVEHVQVSYTDNGLESADIFLRQSAPAEADRPCRSTLQHHLFRWLQLHPADDRCFHLQRPSQARYPKRNEALQRRTGLSRRRSRSRPCLQWQKSRKRITYQSPSTNPKRLANQSTQTSTLSRVEARMPQSVKGGGER